MGTHSILFHGELAKTISELSSSTIHIWTNTVMTFGLFFSFEDEDVFGLVFENMYFSPRIMCFSCLVYL